MLLEPVTYFEAVNAHAGRLVSGRRTLALVFPPEGLGAPSAVARARRLAAAVNAAEGVPTEALEALAEAGALRALYESGRLLGGHGGAPE